VSQDGGQTYTKIPAVLKDGAYTFTAENVDADTVISVVTAGDADGDGEITNDDVASLRSAYTGASSLSALEMIAADTNGDGKLTNADITRLRAAAAGKTTLKW